MSLKKKMLILLLLAMVAVFVAFAANYYFLTGPEGARSFNLFYMLSVEMILLAWGVFIARSTFKPIHATLEDLAVVREGVEESSSNAHDTSKSLANGAANQAASLEETAASLEEITSMTIHNAQNADQGRTLMEEAQSLVERASDSMGKMNQAMSEISGASQQIGKIIKKIDEIAFQTNLLALNAAVEAARAGEHGTGFAVVAEQVRNLSQRAAGAAKDTQDLVKNALVKVKGGVELVSQTESNFTEMVKSSCKATALVQEIAQGSKDQRTGLEQISEAMTQIDQVTQKNAEQASESARVSERMQDSTQGLRQSISDLATILEGGHQRREAINLVKKAVVMAKKKGMDATLAAIQDKNGPFMKGEEMYVYAGSTEVVTLLAHPVLPDKLVGPDLTDWPDGRGKKFFNELVDVAVNQGEGWVNYWWPKPGAEKPSLKSTYVLKVPGEQAYFASGIYA